MCVSLGPLFWRCEVYDWPPFFQQKIYDWPDFSLFVYESPHFSYIPVYACIFRSETFGGCLFSWYSMNWLLYLSNYQQWMGIKIKGQYMNRSTFRTTKYMNGSVFFFFFFFFFFVLFSKARQRPERKAIHQTDHRHLTKLLFCSSLVFALIRYPVSILRKSISGRHRPVRVADGPMTARCRFT